MKFKILGLFAILFILHGCNFGTGPTGGGTGAEGLTGILVDGGGKVVANAKVWVYPDSSTLLAKSSQAFVARRDSTTTNVQGRYDFKKLPAGRYNLTASIVRHDTTYAFFVGGIVYNGGKLDLGADTLYEASELWVNVTDDQENVIAGATCDIPGTQWRTLSDANGDCVLTGVAAGDLVVRVASTGKQTVTSPVTVGAGETSAACQFYLAAERSVAIPGAWVLTSLQGFTYSLPPDLILWSERYGLDTWSAYYQSPSMILSLLSGMVVGQGLPENLAEYTEESWTLDSTGSTIKGATMVTYRIPDSLKALYPGANYLAQLYITSGYQVSFAVTYPFATAQCKTPQALEIAKTVLRSFNIWKGPGAAPVPAPFKPTLLSPAKALVGSLVSPTLLWRNQSGSTLTKYYRLQLAKDSTFLSLVTNDSVMGGDLFTDTLGRLVGPLSLNTWHYWRVVAVGPGGQTFSETRSFFPYQAPSAPLLGLPLDGEDSVAVSSAVLSWEAPAIAGTVASYRVQVSFDSLFTSLFEDTLLSAGSTNFKVTYKTSIQGGGKSLLENTRYYWRVIAIGSLGSEVASVLRRFTTTPITPSTRTLISPTAAATGISVSPTLSWAALVDGDFWKYFRVQISEDSLFTSLALSDSIREPIFDGSYNCRVGPLKHNTRYFWRVLAGGSAPEAVSYSQTRSFTTVAVNADPLPISPQLPVTNATQYASTYTFRWETAPQGSGTQYYHLQIAEDSLFIDPVVNDTVAPGTNPYTDAGFTGRNVTVSLKTNVPYFWRVLGVGAGGVTSSEIRIMTPYAWVAKRNAK